MVSGMPNMNTMDESFIHKHSERLHIGPSANDRIFDGASSTQRLDHSHSLIEQEEE